MKWNDFNTFRPALGIFFIFGFFGIEDSEPEEATIGDSELTSNKYNLYFICIVFTVWSFAFCEKEVTIFFIFFAFGIFFIFGFFGISDSEKAEDKEDSKLQKKIPKAEHRMQNFEDSAGSEF
uniref:Uncharacterized protein n=1 Tax=Pediastrum angulosum TaxID=271408 RepID=A0A2U8GHL7_9CHLO|nr:hypothetical protein [Pediastrum angulosum]AWI68169.1 hypothetical protein [Pediastrum angulosum]